MKTYKNPDIDVRKLNRAPGVTKRCVMCRKFEPIDKFSRYSSGLGRICQECTDRPELRGHTPLLPSDLCAGVLLFNSFVSGAYNRE